MMELQGREQFFEVRRKRATQANNAFAFSSEYGVAPSESKGCRHKNATETTIKQIGILIFETECVHV